MIPTITPTTIPTLSQTILNSPNTFEFAQTILVFIKDIVTTIAAGAAGYAAFFGYRNWQRQLQGQSKYELAKRLMNQIYKTRNTIMNVRIPAQLPTEVENAVNNELIKLEGLYNEHEREILKFTIYKRSEPLVLFERFKEIQYQFAELDSLALEAEAFWGEKIYEKLKPLYDCANTLYFAIQNYKQELIKSQQSNREYSLSENYYIVYAVKERKEDSFFLELNSSVRKIENFFKEYLRIETGLFKNRNKGN